MIMNIPCKSNPMPYYVGHYEPDYSTLPLTFQSTGNTTVAIKKDGLSYNKKTAATGQLTGWTSYTSGSLISLSDGDTVAFSGTNSQINATFSSTSSTGGTLEVYGNAHSLINWGNMTTQNCFGNLFNANKQLVKADNLVLSSLNTTQSCYNHMFANCSNLVYGPQLPATGLSLGCYEGTFENCSNLITDFVLPASSIPAQRGYHYLFSQCYKLTSIEVALTSWTNVGQSWVKGITTTGTFTCPAALPHTSSYLDSNNYIPKNWTVVTK